MNRPAQAHVPKFRIVGGGRAIKRADASATILIFYLPARLGIRVLTLHLSRALTFLVAELRPNLVLRPTGLPAALTVSSDYAFLVIAPPPPSLLLPELGTPELKLWDFSFSYSGCQCYDHPIHSCLRECTTWELSRKAQSQASNGEA